MYKNILNTLYHEHKIQLWDELNEQISNELYDRIHVLLKYHRDNMLAILINQIYNEIKQ